MTKNDLLLIHSFVDKLNPKLSLNYAVLSHDGIYATDTRKAIKFHIPMLDCNNFLANKKAIKCVAACLGKDETARINAEGEVYFGNFDKISLNNATENLDIIDFDRILDQKLDYGLTLDSISDIEFELSTRECFIDMEHLSPIIQFSSCTKYEVFYNKQIVKDGFTNTGIVKIVGLYNTEDEHGLIKFTAVVMGREFKTQAKEQLLFEV